jgi:hypothetical protein
MTTLSANQLSSNLDLTGKTILLPIETDAVVHYPSRSDFPTLGRLKRIYIAEDTSAHWHWTGTTYQISAPTTDEFATLEGQVSATEDAIAAETTARIAADSALQSAISAQSGTLTASIEALETDLAHLTANLDPAALDSVAEAAASIGTLTTTLATVQDRQRQVHARLYHDNAAVFASGRPGTEDPSSLVRPGWYFTNSSAGQKINWFFWSIAQPGIPSIPASDFAPYAVLTPDTLGSSPFITAYSAPTGSGDAAPGFYHSAWVYQLPTATRNALTPGQKVLLYAQADPVCHPGLLHRELTFVPSASHGERLPTETIAFAALHSDSGSSPGSVQWLIESLGVDHPTLRLEIALAIRPIATSQTEILKGFEQVATFASLPSPGRLTRLYLVQESNQTYRWTGSAYRLTPDALDGGQY